MNKIFLPIIILGLLLQFTQPAYGYTTNMSASVVIGSTDFTTNNGGVSRTMLNTPVGVASDGTRLFIADYSNNRILIYNTIPTTNNAPADVVIGQTNFLSGDEFQNGSAAANAFSTPAGMDTDGKRLFVAEEGSNRVLIFNSIPTSNNASADVVVGQPNMTTTSTGTTASKMNAPYAVSYDPQSGKLAVADALNHRILIYNKVPTTNGVAADVVVGQPDFSTVTSGTTRSKINNPDGVKLVDNKLIIGETGGNRVLIYNSIPTTNGASADIVLGQSDFTSSLANQCGCTTANPGSFANVDGIGYDGRRLFIADDANNRVLIFNGIPTVSNPSASMVIGQANFENTLSDQGFDGPKANTLDGVQFLTVVGNKLIVADAINNRVLIYNNTVSTPQVTINNSPESVSTGKIRMRGSAKVESTYPIRNVQYSVNGGSWSEASASDGAFDSRSEAFYVDFLPSENNNTFDGYTMSVRAFNQGLDVSGNAIFFDPFVPLSPLANATVTTALPEFDFSINKQTPLITANISKYQILLRRPLGNWYVYIDDIAPSAPPGSEILETSTYVARYQDNYSRVKVLPKRNRLSGAYEWKVRTVDKENHSQETAPRMFRVKSGDIVSSIWFPLSILKISGVESVHMSTIAPAESLIQYALLSQEPTFYGIAFAGSTVTLELSEEDCVEDPNQACTHVYATVTGDDSRWGIQTPSKTLNEHSSYLVRFSVSLGDLYNELPAFILQL